MRDTLIDAVPGPFKREDYKILAADGRKIATVAVSARISTEITELTGDLLAASWQLRELLRHALTCSGPPADCETCREAADLVQLGAS